MNDPALPQDAVDLGQRERVAVAAAGPQGVESIGELDHLARSLSD